MRRLGISNDFTFGLDLSISSSPLGLTFGRSGLPDPFAPTPLQGHHLYYGPVRPCAPHRYSAPRGVRHLGFFLSRPGGHLTHFDWPSVSERQVLLFHASAC